MALPSVSINAQSPPATLHNHYEAHKFLRREAPGRLVNIHGQRNILVSEDFIIGYQVALEEEVGDAASEIMYRCGFEWGRQDIAGFETRFTEEFGRAPADAKFGMMLETWWWPLQAAGWGAWRYDLSHRKEGLVFVDLFDSAVAKSIGNVGKVVCHYYAGMFAAVFGTPEVPLVTEDLPKRPTSPYGALTAAGLAGTALEPLSAHVDKMLVPRGIHTVPRGFGWDPVAGCDHVKGVGHRLTARPLDEGTLYATGASLDQVIATQLNDGGTPALNLHVGYRYQGTNGVVSYTGANGPAVGENNPWLVYQDLMGLSNLDDVAIMRLTARRESVLDLVERDFNRIGGGSISQADRAKLDMHLTAIRDLEVGMGEAGLIPCMLDDGRVSELQALEGANVDADSEYKRIGLLQMDILALALACGANHAATLMWGSEAGGPVFTWDGMSHQYNHHKLSHGNTADDCSGSAVDGYLDMLFDIDRWYATQLAYLLDQLDADRKSVV